MDKLTEQEIEMQLKGMKNWNFTANEITKNFVFPNFVEAINFVNKIANLAEEKSHHPDIKIFNYRNVTISLTTHSAGGVTQKDIDLAKAIDLIY